jgi:hypothetical protein
MSNTAQLRHHIAKIATNLACENGRAAAAKSDSIPGAR